MKKRTPQKRLVAETVDNFSGYDLDGPVESLLFRCQQLIETYGPTVSLDFGQHCAYDDAYSFNVRIQREETDAEFEERVGVEVANQKKTEEYERAQLATLLAKYGDKP